MSKQILEVLKRKKEELGSEYGNLNAETFRNSLKEELQFYVLNFIYNHPDYSSWIMYGGSALRIVHGLDRLSVDLDFEVSVPVTEKLLEELKVEIEKYFVNNYGTVESENFLTIKITNNRGLRLNFEVEGDKIIVKIDLNHFVATKTVTERRPIVRGQLSFVIVTYNMSNLMSSKIAAIFLRGIRTVGSFAYEEKGRDIYDLLWYMNKKTIPDLDYLKAKNIDVKNPSELFDKLTLKMNKVSDQNLKNDLSPLFLNSSFISNWLKNWRELYFSLLENYKILNIIQLKDIHVLRDLLTSCYYFTYSYATKECKTVDFYYDISDYWIDFKDGDLNIEVTKNVEEKMTFTMNGASSRQIPLDKLKQYARLFLEKTEKYIESNDKMVMGNVFKTKLIRMTGGNLNPNTQIILNKSALLNCTLDDLFR